MSTDTDPWQLAVGTEIQFVVSTVVIRQKGDEVLLAFEDGTFLSVNRRKISGGIYNA